MIRPIAVSISHFAIAVSLRAQSLQVEALRTEYQQNPVGIDVPAPRLSWRLQAVRRGTMQYAYHVRAATVHLPGARLEQVREGGLLLASTPGVTRTVQSGDTVLVEIGSGIYEFEYEAPALAARLRGWSSESVRQ